MINRITQGGMLALMLGVTATAHAGPVSQGTGYVGAMFAQGTYDEEGISEDANPNVIVLRAGGFVTDYFALEARGGFGVASDTVTATGYDAWGQPVQVNVEFEIDYMFGAYALGHIPLGDVAALYGTLGMTSAQATVSAQGYSWTDTDTGLSYGAGLEVYPSERFGINLEYMSYMDGDGYDFTAMSLGFKGLF